jgi:hypothetical protein
MSDWRARSFKTFISYREPPRNGSHPAAYTNGRSIYYKSGTESEKPRDEETRQIKSQSVATVPSTKEREPYTAERSLEMQKKLLQTIARRENIVKGYQDEKCSTNGEKMVEMGEGSEHSCTAEADLEEWKREIAEGLYMIWGRK